MTIKPRHVTDGYKYVTVTRPDGAKLYLNINQIVYVTRDPADDTGSKTELVTSQGAFIIKSSVEKVIETLEYGAGEL